MQRILILGFGDIGRRFAQRMAGRARLYALVRSAAAAADARAAGVTPVRGDLDDPRSLRRLAGLAGVIVHLAPPLASAADDRRTRQLLAVLGQAGMIPQAILYISTTGIYGDCGGAWVDESRPAQPRTARARRRADAERALRDFGARTGCRCVLLRAPGIWASDRLPAARLSAGTPVIRREEDSYTNHIHADDLASILAAAWSRGAPNRAYNACDDAPSLMGDWFDAVADALALPRPPRLPRDAARAVLPDSLWSFAAESRRLSNRRLHRELGVRLRYPSAVTALAGGSHG